MRRAFVLLALLWAAPILAQFEPPPGGGAGGGSGTVTSVDATVPSILSLSGNPITESGTLAFSLTSQTANQVFAGPSSGGAVAPTFRLLVAGDLPSTAVTPGSYTYASLTVDQQGRLTAASSGATPATLGANTFTAGQVVDGSADEIQLRVQGNATQTSDLFVVEKSDGTDVFAIGASGIADGTSAAPGLPFKTGIGLYGTASGLWFVDGGATVMGYEGWDSPVAPTWRLAKAGRIMWADTTNPATGNASVGFRRSVNSLLVADATLTSFGTFLSGRLVEANTAVSGAPNAITAIETWSVYTNEGATAENHHTLPTAVVGATYTFVVQDADGLRVTAAAGDTIRIAGTVSAAGGNISSATIGNTVTLVAINATEWVAIASHGTWTFDAP